MSPSITPVAKALYICDATIGFPDQKTDVMGIFSSIRADDYPYIHPQFVVFAQLCGGLGQVPFFIDVLFASTGKLVHTSTARLLKFAHRDQVVHLSFTIPGCIFPQPGIYLVELHCNAQWVADVKLELQ